jgi:hypothetical protein
MAPTVQNKNKSSIMKHPQKYSGLVGGVDLILDI